MKAWESIGRSFRYDAWRLAQETHRLFLAAGIDPDWKDETK